MTREQPPVACDSRLELARGFVVEDEGEGFFLILEMGETDFTLSFPDDAGSKLAAFIQAHILRRQ